MTVLAIDHINISGPAGLMERCRDFYRDVIGLVDGHRPPFRSQGFWLYAADRPVVHLTVHPDGTASMTERAFGFNHYAFQCQGLDAMIERLQAGGVAFEVDRVPGTNSAQVFLSDPAGVALELNFASG